MAHWRSRLVQAGQRLNQQKPVWLSAGGMAMLVLAMRWAGLLQSWEWSLGDWLFRLRPSEDREERLLIVEITEDDINEGRTWPVSDQQLSQLIRRLAAAKPAVIGLDVYRDFPVEPGHGELMETLTEFEQVIAIERIADALTPGTPPPDYLPPERIGFNNAVVDGDGYTRRGLLYLHDDEEEPHMSLALRAALVYLHSAYGIEPEPSRDRDPHLQLAQQVLRKMNPNDGPYVQADTKGYQILLNFRDPARFETVSMGEVLEGSVSAELIRDRVVLIGPGAESIKDKFLIPFSGRGSQAPEHVWGVELHANIVSQILSAALDNRPLLQVWPEPIEAVWILLWSSAGALLCWRLRDPVKNVGAIAGLSVVLAGVVYGSFLGGWWLPFVPPALAAWGASFLMSGYLVYQAEQFKRSTDFLRSVIDNIPDPIFVKDQQFRWMILNQAFCDFSGLPRAELIGKTDYDVFQPEEAKAFREEEAQLFLSQTPHEIEEHYTNRDGETYLSATKRSLHRDAAGNVFLVGVIRDITERKRIEDELRRTTAELTRSNSELEQTRDRLQKLAYTDALTGLANRKAFYENLAATLQWAEHHERFVALLYLDLDGFKQVNDRLGHHFGDLLLKAVAGRITNCLRDSDTVARLGGDEFTVILPGIKQPEHTSIVAAKIISTLTQPYLLEDEPVQITVSIGSSVYPTDSTSEIQLINLADRAMYKAKELGRNQHQSATPSPSAEQAIADSV